MRIIWSPLSVERLEDIYDYIAMDNKIAAVTLIEEIFEKVETLKRNAQRGRIVPEAERKDIRELFVGEYRIIYKIEKDQIVILTVRNFKQLLPGTDVI